MPKIILVQVSDEGRVLCSWGLFESEQRAKEFAEDINHDDFSNRLDRLLYEEFGADKPQYDPLVWNNHCGISQEGSNFYISWLECFEQKPEGC